MSARRRTPPPRHCTEEKIGEAHERRRVKRFVGREIDAEVAEVFGYRRLTVGGEDDWAECEARWFGDAA